jgi:hypothetical protein
MLILFSAKAHHIASAFAKSLKRKYGGAWLIPTSPVNRLEVALLHCFAQCPVLRTVRTFSSHPILIRHIEKNKYHF